jgi:cell shape-determining protein MreC
MTYLSDKSRKEKRFRWKVVFFGLLLVLCASWPTSRLKLYPYAEHILVAFHGVYQGVVSLPRTLHEYITSRDVYEARIALLEARTEELENRLMFGSIPGERTATSTQTAVHTTDSVVLYSLAEDISSLYQSVILSLGFKDNIQEGSVVYLRGRQAVCTIHEVHASTSLCKLLAYQGNVVEGVVIHDTETESLSLVGDGGGNYVVTLPKETHVTRGDTVLYKADQTMVLGTIADVQNDGQDVFVRVYVRGAYNPVTATRFYVDKE